MDAVSGRDWAEYFLVVVLKIGNVIGVLGLTRIRRRGRVSRVAGYVISSLVGRIRGDLSGAGVRE